MSTVIHHTFGPHASCAFALQSLGLLMRPWKWTKGTEREHLREALRDSLRGDVFLFASGREALLALLRALHLKTGEEVIIQGYTCVVVPNAIHAAGGVPIYADIDGDTLNLDCDDVARRITPRTRAVIVQHTFGIPGNLKRLRTICDAQSITLIEDCAHVLPDDPASPIARTGDFTILSFGRDKAISGVSGGAVIARKADTTSALKDMESAAGILPCSVIARYLLYPLIYRKARALYTIGLGRVYLALCKKLRLLIPIVTGNEKHGDMQPLLSHCPNACAALALYSMKRLPQTNTHRRALTQFYINECEKNGWNVLPGICNPSSGSGQALQPATHPLQKFPLFFPNADAIRQSLKRNNIHLDDGWTGCVVCPRSVEPLDAGYTAGNDPDAESTCERILSLPTHPTMTMRQAERLTATLSSVLHSEPHDH
jgi:dTDP-4-amino-4,6-dideoxygalactose transaminase